MYYVNWKLLFEFGFIFFVLMCALNYFAAERQFNVTGISKIIKNIFKNAKCLIYYLSNILLNKRAIPSIITRLFKRLLKNKYKKK